VDLPIVILSTAIAFDVLNRIRNDELRPFRRIKDFQRICPVALLRPKSYRHF
jgi:hypothetical protein